ncbi:MAG TPA: hypothetical protein VHW04_14845 [Solirubrobacteraceae bacterium]|nr:hypothetical protein [Solirubrobacteraceae bacterium]
MSDGYLGGLRPNGTLLVVGADMNPIEVPAAAFIAGVSGRASGTWLDSEDTLAFSLGRASSR